MKLTRRMAWPSLAILSMLVATAFCASLNSFNNNELETSLTETKDCARSCSERNNVLQYKTGSSYDYQVELTTSMHQMDEELVDHADHSEHSITIRTKATISVHSPCEFVLHLSKIELEGVRDEAQRRVLSEQLARHAMHFAYDDGQVQSVCGRREVDDEPKWVVNVKRSIISALQMSVQQFHREEKIVETDISGKCDTLYIPLENRSNKMVVRKVKQLNQCSHRHTSNIALFPRSYLGLDQAIRQSLPMINGTQECVQTIQDGLIEAVQCQDRQTMWPSTMGVHSRLTIKLISSKPKLTVARLNQEGEVNQWERYPLIMSTHQAGHHVRHNELYNRDDSRRVDYSREDASRLLKEICIKSDEAIDMHLPEIFAELVQVKKSLNVEDERYLFRTIRERQVCGEASERLMDIFLDASALTGSEGAIDVLIHAYELNLISPTRASYLFSLLSFVQEPTVQGATKLVQLLEIASTKLAHDSLPRGVILGISGYVQNLQHVQQGSHSPSVQQLVQQTVNILLNQLEQTIRRQGEPGQIVGQALALVNGIRNVGLQVDQVESVQTIAQRLIKLVQSIGADQPVWQPIRVALVRVLSHVQSEQVRQFLLEKLIQNQRETLSVQIEAYRSLIFTGPSVQELQSLKSYIVQVDQPRSQGEQLANYVRSHQINIRSSSDPAKQQLLPVNAPDFGPAKSQVYGLSRNYELSYLNQQYGVGVVAEGDLVFGQEEQRRRSPVQVPVPSQVTLNLTVPVLGKQLQVVEVRVYQQGLEQIVAERLLRENSDKFFKGNNKQSNMIVLAKQILETLLTEGPQLLESNSNAHVQVELAIDGKTLIVLDERDIIYGEIIPHRELINDILSQLEKKVKIDRAFALIPIDTLIQLPTMNGLPVQIRLNSSLVFGIKADIDVDWTRPQEGRMNIKLNPSISGQLESGFDFVLGSEKKSLNTVHRVHFAPHLGWRLKMADGRRLSLEVDAPKRDQHTIARFESRMVRGDQQDEVARRSAASLLQVLERNHKGSQRMCTEWTKKVFGVALCINSASFKESEKSNDLITELVLERFDESLTNYLLEVELPFSIETLFAVPMNELSYSRLIRTQDRREPIIRLAFNTPNSRVDREIELKVKLPSVGDSSADRKEIALELKSPWKLISASALIRNEQRTRLVAIRVECDGSKWMQAEIGYELVGQRGGNSMEYRPRVVLILPGQYQPINLVGQVKVTNTVNKYALDVLLEDQSRAQTYLKIKHILNHQQSMVSTHALFDLFGFSGDWTLAGENNSKSTRFDLNGNYRAPWMRSTEKVQLKLTSQNHSTQSLIKWTNFGKLLISQYPAYNAVYSHVFMFNGGESMEHDLIVDWNRKNIDQTDESTDESPETIKDRSQIRLLQTAKWESFRGKWQIEGQSRTIIRPKQIDYELTGNIGLVGFGQNNQKRYNILLKGLDRTSQQSPANFDAEFAYSHLSKSPMKMKMRATLKAKDVNMVYNDEIEQVGPSSYKGRVSVQLAEDAIYNADYTFKSEWDASREQRHELEVDIQSNRPAVWHGHHRALLRMVPNELFQLQTELKSTGQEGGDKIFDAQLKYNKKGESLYELNHYGKGLKGRFMVNPYSSPVRSELVWQDGQGLKHETRGELDRESRAFKLDSRTQGVNKENLLSFESHYQPESEDRARFELEHPSIKSRFHLKQKKDQENWMRFGLDLPSYKSLQHESTLLANLDDDKYSLTSRTSKAGRDLASIEAKYEPEEDNYFRVDSDLVKADLGLNKQKSNGHVRFESGPYEHESRLERLPNKWTIESRTKSQGRTLANLKYKLDGPNHSFQLESDDRVQAQAEGCWNKEECIKNYGKLNFLTPEGIRHESELEQDRDSRVVRFNSETADKRNQKLAHIKAQLATGNNQDKSFVNFRSDRAQINSNFELNPVKREALFDITHPQYKHSTQFRLDKKKPEEGLLNSQWMLNTETRSLVGEPRAYRLNVENHPEESTKMALEVPRFDSKFQLDRANVDDAQLAFDFNDKRTSSSSSSSAWNSIHPVQHSSLIRMKRTNRDEPLVQLKSETRSKLTGDNLLSLEGEYRHQDQEEPSYLTAQYGRDLKGKLEMNPYGPAQKYISLNGESGGYSHKTNLMVNPIDSWIDLKSVTKRRDARNVADLDVLLHRDSDKPSHIKLAMPETSGHLWLHPAQRVLKSSLNTPTIAHQAHLFTEKDDQDRASFNIDSQTKYRDSILARVQASLQGLQGRNKIDLESPRFQLKSNVDLPEQKADFDVITDVESRRHAKRHILGSVYVNQGNNKDQSKSIFHVDFAWDQDAQPQSKVLVNLKVGPTGSSNSYSSSAQQFLTELQVEYIQNRFIASALLTPQSVGQLLHNDIKLKVAFEPVSGAAVANRNQYWSVVYEHINGNHQQQTGQQQGQYQCRLNFARGQQIVYGVEINGQLTPSKYVLNGKTIVPSRPELELTIDVQGGVAQADGTSASTSIVSYYADVSVVRAVGKNNGIYKATINVDVDTANYVYNGKAVVNAPNWETHQITFSGNLGQRSVQVSLVNGKTGEKFEFIVSYLDDLVHVSTVSNIPFFPLIDAKLKLAQWRDLFINIDLDGQRKLELITKLDGTLSLEQKFNFFFKFNSLISPSVEVIANGARLPNGAGPVSVIHPAHSIKVLVNYQAEQVFSGKFKHLPSVTAGNGAYEWTVEGVISQHGAELASATVELLQSQSKQKKWAFAYVPSEQLVTQSGNGYYGYYAIVAQPLKVQLTSKLVDSNSQLHYVELEVVRSGNQKVLDGQVYVGFGQSTGILSVVPSFIRGSIQHVPTNNRYSLRVTLWEVINQHTPSELKEEVSKQISLFSAQPFRSVQRQVLNSFVVGVNQQNYGFIAITTKHAPSAGNGIALENQLALSLGPQTVVFQNAYQFSSSIWEYQSTFRSQQDQITPVYALQAVIQADSSLLQGKLQVNSPTLFVRSPKVVSFVQRRATPLRPVDVEVVVDLGKRQQDVITLTSVVERTHPQSSIFGGQVREQNTTVKFEVKSQDLLVDYSLAGHVSASSYGLVWKNHHGHGVYQQGYYQLRLTGNQGFEVDWVDGQAEYYYTISGVYRYQPTISVDFIVKQWAQKGGRSYVVRPASAALPVQQYKVHAQQSGQCLTGEIISLISASAQQQQPQQLKQVNVCFNLNKANLVTVSLDSIENGQKISDLNIKLATVRGGEALKLFFHWNPVYQQQILAYVVNAYQTQSQVNYGELPLQQVIEAVFGDELWTKLVIIYQKISNDLPLNLNVDLEQILVPILSRFGLDYQQIAAISEGFIYGLISLVDENIEQVGEWIQAIVAKIQLPIIDYLQQSLSQSCQKNALCSTWINFVEQLIQLNPQQLAQWIAGELVQALQHGHRFVLTTRGGQQWIQSWLANLPQVPEQIEQAFDVTIGALWTLVASTVDSNPALQQVIIQLESIWTQLITSPQWRQINWTQVNASIEQVVQLLLSPSTWISSTRVVNYDPTSGDLAVELTSPWTVRQLVNKSNNIFQQQQAQPVYAY